MPTTHHHPNTDTAGCLLKGNTPAAIFKSNSCFSVVLERTAPFLYSTGLATAGRNNELTDTCKMPLLYLYYLSPAPHYVHISSNWKLRQSLFVSFLTLLPDLKHVKSAPCSFEAAGSFTDLARRSPRQMYIMSKDWQTIPSKISSGNICSL